eukprot:s3838_g7.t1
MAVTNVAESKTCNGMRGGHHQRHGLKALPSTALSWANSVGWLKSDSGARLSAATGSRSSRSKHRRNSFLAWDSPCAWRGGRTKMSLLKGLQLDEAEFETRSARPRASDGPIHLKQRLFEHSVPSLASASLQQLQTACFRIHPFTCLTASVQGLSVHPCKSCSQWKV